MILLWGLNQESGRYIYILQYSALFSFWRCFFGTPRNLGYKATISRGTLNVCKLMFWNSVLLIKSQKKCTEGMTAVSCAHAPDGAR